MISSDHSFRSPINVLNSAVLECISDQLFKQIAVKSICINQINKLQARICGFLLARLALSISARYQHHLFGGNLHASQPARAAEPHNTRVSTLIVLS